MTVLIDEIGQYRNSDVGAMSDDRVMHMAPPENQVHRLMGDLLNWVAEGNEHPLIKSSIFHYEFKFIHHFVGGNERMGRVWQTLILSL